MRKKTIKRVFVIVIAILILFLFIYRTVNFINYNRYKMFRYDLSTDVFRRNKDDFETVAKFMIKTYENEKSVNNSLSDVTWLPGCEMSDGMIVLCFRYEDSDEWGDATVALDVGVDNAIKRIYNLFYENNNTYGLLEFITCYGNEVCFRRNVYQIIYTVDIFPSNDNMFMGKDMYVRRLSWHWFHSVPK